MTILVKDIMVDPLTIDLNKSVKATGEYMKENRIGSVIVTKNNHPIGIITDSDLIKKIVAKDVKPSSIKAKDIMSKPLVAVSPDDTILDATRKMKRNNIKRLPVLDKDKIVGVISLSDIARTTPEMVDLLEYKLKMREWPTEIKEKFTSGICESCGNYSPDLRSMSNQWLCEDCREEVEE